MRRSYYLNEDPYSETLHGYMRQAKICIAIALITFVAAIALRIYGTEHLVIYGPLIEQLQFIVSVGFIGISAISSFIAAFNIARILYYQAWPDRF